jgi:hypothetical protein
MQFRSTNLKFTHFQGDIVSNVDDSSHGVKLSGGSTGGLVEPVGDETNIALTVRAKGTGPLVLGSTGTAVTLGGSGTISIGSSGGTVNVGSSGGPVFIAGSTVPFLGFMRFTDTAVATPNFATTNAMVMETTHTITGLPAATLGGTTNAYIIAMPHNLSTDCALVNCYVGSTADQAHCRFAKVSTLTVAATTATISFLVIRV